MGDRKLILAIDFNNILFSSYYGEKLLNSRGENVNAVKGFFYRLRTLKESLDPDYIVMANDISRAKTFRRKLYEPYKANRKVHDEDIMNQMTIASNISAMLGFPFINNELYEADDVLGMIGKYGEDNNMDVIIASSDKDLYQLVSDTTSILCPRSNSIIDKAYMQREYQLSPSQWIEYKMLVGDSGDNIPGVRGIGKVTASKMMVKYGSLNVLYENLSELKPGEQTKLLNDQPNLPLIRTLVTIVTDYNLINLNDSSFERIEMCLDELYDKINKHEIYSLHDVMKYSLTVEKQSLKEYNN